MRPLTPDVTVVVMCNGRNSPKSVTSGDQNSSKNVDFLLKTPPRCRGGVATGGNRGGRKCAVKKSLSAAAAVDLDPEFNSGSIGDGFRV